MTHLANISSYSLPELRQIFQEVESAIAEKEEAQRTAALEAAMKAAKELGFDLDEIHQGQGIKSQKNVYVHPTDSSLTWSGKGRRPKWLNTLLEQGADLETFKK